MGPDATSAKDLARSLLEILEILENVHTEGDRKTSSDVCQVLAQQDGADRVVGFFGSSCRNTDHKVELTAFRRKMLEDGFDKDTS